MKKLLSIFLAGVILISSLTFSTNAFAVDEKNINSYAQEQIESAGEYLIKNSDRFNLDNAVDFLLYLKAGVLTDAQKKYFVKNVNENFKANKNRLIGSNGENLGIYGAVIQSFEFMGLDVKNFVSAFEKLNPKSECHPYYYRIAIEAADKDFAKKICQAFIDQYYTLGQGMNYWGYSCDNTAHFLTAISKYKNDFSKYANDAKEIIKKHTNENGAFFNSDYGTDANSNSTALAMMAFSSIGDSKEALNYYNKLIKNFESSKGIFTYNGEVSAYSTKDALLALEYLINPNPQYHNYKVTKTNYNRCDKVDVETKTCTLCGKVEKKNLNKTKKHSYTSKVTKAPTSSAEGVMTYSCKNCSYKYTKKIAKLGKTSIKVSSAKKGFKVSWKKVNSATGYVIQYSRYSDFKNAKKITITKNSTVSKTVKDLSSKKKYYVRVKTYRTINGKKYYSNYSSKKSVTTK